MARAIRSVVVDPEERKREHHVCRDVQRRRQYNAKLSYAIIDDTHLSFLSIDDVCPKCTEGEQS